MYGRQAINCFYDAQQAGALSLTEVEDLTDELTETINERRFSLVIFAPSRRGKDRLVLHLGYDIPTLEFCLDVLQVNRQLRDYIFELIRQGLGHVHFFVYTELINLYVKEDGSEKFGCYEITPFDKIQTLTPQIHHSQQQ